MPAPRWHRQLLLPGVRLGSLRSSGSAPGRVGPLAASDSASTTILETEGHHRLPGLWARHEPLWALGLSSVKRVH